MRRLLLIVLMLLAPAAGAGQFRLGVVSERADQPGYVLQQYDDLLAWLSARLALEDMRVAPLTIARDVSELAQMVRQGRVDAVFESVFPLIAMQAAGAKLDPALAAWRRGRRESRTVFFTRQDSAVERLADLRGKTLVLESQRSTTAFALPRAELAAHQLTSVPDGPETRETPGVRYLLAGSEESQAYWVVAGRADAGAFNTEDWDELPDSVRSQLRIFHSTGPILRWMLAFRAGYAARDRAAVERALLAMPEDEAGRAALAKARRILRIDPVTPFDRGEIERWRRIARHH